MVFMVDSGAERSSVTKVPEGMGLGEKQVRISGVGGKVMTATEVEGVVVKYENREVSGRF